MNNNSIHPVIVSIEPGKEAEIHEEKFSKDISKKAFVATLVTGVALGAAAATIISYIDRKIDQVHEMEQLEQTFDYQSSESK